MHSIPDGLPPWGQALASLIVLAGFGFTIWRSVTAKRIAGGQSEASNVLVAGDIMSTKPMKDLAHAVEDLAASQDRTTAAIERNTAATYANEAAVREMCRAFERSRQ